MRHPDDGTIHAWLDGALAPEEARRLEQHVASCAMCGDAVAEARGLVASSSRILGALDTLPGDVVPRTRASPGGQRAARWWTRPVIPAAAAALLVVAVSFAMLGRPAERGPLADRSAVREALPSISAEMEESAADQFHSVPSSDVAAEAIPSATTARAPQVAATDELPRTTAARDTRGAGEGPAVMRAAPPSPSPAPAAAGDHLAEAEVEVSARVFAGQAAAKTDPVRADLPRAPAAPDTNRLRIGGLAVTPAPPEAHGAPDTSRLGRAEQAAPARTPSLAMGIAEASTDDTARVQLVVVSQRADTNLLGVVRTTIYVVRPGVQVTHQAIERRFQPAGRERVPADTSAEADAAGERTLITLDMARVQAIHWTDAAGVYHSLSGPVEQEELARIRVALRERAPDKP